MVVIVLQWNARSLISNGQEFKKYVDDFNVKPHIICVQETWLKPNLSFVVQGYSVVRKDRNKGTGGGVITFIKQDVAFREVNVIEELEAVVVEVKAESQNIRIINFYNPCKSLNKELYKDIGGDGKCRVVWCGDFNAHSTLWGSTNNDPNGNVVEEILDENDLVCLNDGSVTRMDVVRGRHSVLDLTIVSSGLARKCKWEVCEQSSMGSDHYPIKCSIGMEVEECLEENIQRWRFKKSKLGRVQRNM